MAKIENLKKNLCPECGLELNWDSEDELLKCECGYNITEDLFKDFMDEIIAREYKIPTVDENLTRLNNL